MREEIPVTVLCGSLGAGKTTLLNHLLRTAGDRDVAVLVNDMGEVNVDAELVAEGSDVDVTGGVTELSNGCICCELQGDLEAAVVALANDHDFDNLVVEASGISEPEPVARLFTTGSRAAARYRVDAVVAVVDARLFIDAFGGQAVPERRGVDDEGDRPLTDLLVEQVEFADIALLNKADLCTADELDEAEALVRALRPDAEVTRTTHSAVAPDWLLDRDAFDPRAAGERAGWQLALSEAADDHDVPGTVDAPERDQAHGHGDDARGHGEETHGHGDDAHGHGEETHGHGDDAHGDHDHAHPDEVYGVTSFTYRRRRPVHPGRAADLLGDLPGDVVRAKGTVWVAGNDDQRVTYHQAGPSAYAEGAGPWIASLPEVDRELYRSNRPDLEWHVDHGDRRTELVFIGTDIDESALRAALDDALVTDEEWETVSEPSPFPPEEGERVALAEPDPTR